MNYKNKEEVKDDVYFYKRILGYEESIKKITSSKNAFIIIVDSEKKKFTIASKKTKISITPEEDNIQSIILECYYTKKPHIIKNIQRSFLYNSDIDNLINSNSLNDVLVIPILDNLNHIVAIIWVATKKTNHKKFEEKDIKNIDRISLLIKNSIVSNSDNKNIFKKTTDNKLNILAVDDDIIILKYLKTVLKYFDCNLITVFSGIEAIERFKHKNIDIIFIDEIMHGGMNGHQAIAKIREIEKKKNLQKIPIFSLTSDTSKEIREKILLSGATKVLYKPINKKEIIKVISEINMD